MANLAFQVTGFAFQGVGQFAFQGSTDADDDVPTGTGGIDPSGAGIRRRGIVKPTGLLHVPRKEGRKEVADRVDESRDIQAEIAARLAREFGEETALLEEPRPPIVEMSLAEIEAEIGVLLRKKLRTEEDEIILLLLMAAGSA